MSKSLCSIAGCTKTAGVSGSARGWCRAHYHRWQRYGSPHADVRRVYSWAGELCREPGCEGKVEAVGLCEKHYVRHRRIVDPVGAERRRREFERRKEAKRVKAAGGRPRASSCDLCQQPARTVYDHSHETGLFRGWLCDRCNRTLGQVHDDAELLRKMADYLEVNREGILAQHPLNTGAQP